MLKIAVAVLIMSWNNHLQEHCNFETTELYDEYIQLLDTIKPSKRYAMIIAGAMDVERKLDRLRNARINTCSYAAEKFTTGRTAYFAVKRSNHEYLLRRFLTHP